ncbi:MAG: sulfatase-like hydrolase/transferase [Verrucomicrobiales bacterium]|nr:sulfatase-like hydrolase/transferase [Verrucomicrobiales bacterium]
MKALFLPLLLAFAASLSYSAENPHIVLVMADDQGWGQMGYQGHPDLKTPNFDEMAANGLRFDRFYAGASNCSPSRATVLTGRSNDRTGVYNHGYPLRLQEKTIAQALRNAGYATGHFGKWHLNGLRGPGIPVLATDTHSPGAFGFDHWLTATNYFDMNPLLGRMGKFESFEGDSSEVAVAEALKFIGEHAESRPTFTVIWYGTPHDPMIATEKDRAPFAHLPEKTQHQYGEIVAMDRSIGNLRSSLRELGLADNTLIWYCSDNGGLTGIGEGTMGGLRGSKNTMYEGGLRVPGIIEWPARIPNGLVTETPAGTVDIFPTLAEIVGLPEDSRVQPQDGLSLVPLIDGEKMNRSRALPFRHDGRGVLVRKRYKLLSQNGAFELYDLIDDPGETTNLIATRKKIAAEMKAQWKDWNTSVEASDKGADYPEGEVSPGQPERRFWQDDPAYKEHMEALNNQPEIRSWLEKRKEAEARAKARAAKQG